MDRPNPSTNRESKAIQTKSHPEASTYTLTKKRKVDELIYPAPKVHLLNLGWFVVYSGIQQMPVHQVFCGALIRCFWGLLVYISLSLLCSYRSRASALDLDPPLRVGHLRASVLRSHRTGLKEQLLQGLWLRQAGGREGYGCVASLQLQRPVWRCSSLRHAMHSPGEVGPWIMGPWQWRAAQTPRRDGVDSALSRTQAFWWWQKQP